MSSIFVIVFAVDENRINSINQSIFAVIFMEKMGVPPYYSLLPGGSVSRQSLRVRVVDANFSIFRHLQFAILKSICIL